MNDVKKTVYNVYASWSDAIKLYRVALKKGFSYGFIEPLEENDPNVTVDSWGHKKFKSCDINGKIVEIELENAFHTVKVLKTSFGEDMAYHYGAACVPTVLIYRQYKRISNPKFELFKVTLVREY